jgi:hypothetical protein
MRTRRLLSTVAAAALFAAALLWAAGLFATASPPAGVLASDTITITVGDTAPSKLLFELRSLSPAGLAVIGSFALLLASAAATITARRGASRPAHD